jgi:hypothetical protein
MKRPKFITVKWNDHHESDAAWAAAGEEPHPAKFESRGYLIYEDETILEITNTIPLDDTAGANLYGRPLRLLKGAVYYRSDDANRAKKPRNRATKTEIAPQSSEVA